MSESQRFEDWIASQFHYQCIRIDGLMGIYWPGHGEYWVDYDDFDRAIVAL